MNNNNHLFARKRRGPDTKVRTAILSGLLFTLMNGSSDALTLRQRVDNTCGACHAQTHLRPPGNYSLNSGAAAHLPGVFAGATNPTAMVSADPLTAIIIQKPLEGSVTPHGGIKISSSHPTMQALIQWVQRGAPQAEMNRGNPGAALYSADPLDGGTNAADNPSLSYRNAMGADHVIVYVRRQYPVAGFRSLTAGQGGGNLFLQRFNNPNIPVGGEINLTNFPATDDVQNPVVSLDGTKIAFARRTASDSRWQIWQIDSDGNPASLKQLTSGEGHKFQPFYLPYKSDGSPARSGEGGIGFLSTLSGFLDEYETGRTYSLYVCDPSLTPCDPANNSVRQIDFNPSHDIHPWMHQSGLLLFSRWEHNEHQGHNFMSLFQMTAADLSSAGSGLFGAYGEQVHGMGGGNAYHEPSEVLDADFGKTDPDLFDPTYGKMISRLSMRDDMGGWIAGPYHPRLRQGPTGNNFAVPIISTGDMITRGRDVEPDDLDQVGSSQTYRQPKSLLGGRYVVSFATAVERIPVFMPFTQTTNYIINYSSFSIYTFTLDGSGKLDNFVPLIAANDDHVDEVVPLVIKPQPPQIAKPIDLTKHTGVFTSGDVTDRNTNDGQTRGYTVDEVSVVRFVRALQLNQGPVDTGRDTDDGIPTQLVGEAPVHSDGSFAAEVPANVPLQFQVIDKSGRVLVNHKPWLHVAPGAIERCVGCHANHDKPASFQPMIARQSDPHVVNTRRVRQFNFEQDIQPIFTANCVKCHDNALSIGAAGRDRGLSLVGRPTPARTTESFQYLVGGNYVISQQSRRSPLMWWLTGLKLSGSPPTAYPNPSASVPHDQMLSESDLKKIANWIDTGINFRVVENDTVGQGLSPISEGTFINSVWPILEARCLECHRTGGDGGLAFDIDGSSTTVDEEEDMWEERLEQVSMRSNFVIPEASILLRKPLPVNLGGVTHWGQTHWTKESPEYLTIYNWIASVNPLASAAPPPTDLINVNNYPNPFRDVTTFVYGLTGAVATDVKIEIFSQNGKLIRELSGTTTPAASSTTVGWNRVEWDGKDKNGKTMGNDVYFYTVEAVFGDGVKKKTRGKLVKLK